MKPWIIYQKMSAETRVMAQFSHPNIIQLIGITLQPLTLLVEFAPMGDLKSCVKTFKEDGIRLNIRVIQATLIQVMKLVYVVRYCNIHIAIIIVLGC